MPAAIVPVVAAIAGAAAKAVIGGIVGSLVGAVVTFGINALFSRERPGGEFVKGPTSVIRGGDEPVQIIYGEDRVSGVLAFAGTTNRPGGDLNEYMHLVVLLAGHEVEGFGTIWINDNEVRPEDIDANGDVRNDKFDPNPGGLSGLTIKKHLGTDNQAADPSLVSQVEEWTADHRLRGIAYLYLRLFYDRDIYPSGIPNVSALVKGKKLYDPRTGETRYSDNWALVVRDYVASDLGINAPLDEIDEPTFIASANIADEDVPITPSPVQTQKRYTINGSFLANSSPINVIEQMVSAGAGVFSDSQGLYRGYAGAYRPAVVHLTEDHFTSIKVRPAPTRDDRFNRVTGTYRSPAAGFAETDFPAVTNPAYEIEDGEQLTRDLELDFVKDPVRAQRLAKILLERGRQGIVVEGKLMFHAIGVTIGETVTLTIPALGWDRKPFLPTGRTLSNDGIAVVLKEEAPAVYDWNLGEATIGDPAPNTTLPDWSRPTPPTGVSVESGNAALFVAGDGTVQSGMIVRWATQADAFVDGFEVSWNLAGQPATQQTRPAAGDDRALLITPVQDGARYQVRVRSKNITGARSVAVSAPTHTVVGKTARPGAPDQLLVESLVDGTRRFTIVHNTVDADVKSGGGWQIRYFLGDTSNFDAMTPLHDGLLTASPYETSQLAAGRYTFAVKAVDSSGNASAGAAFASNVILEDPPLRNVLVRRLESIEGWPGTRTDAFVDGDRLFADSAGTWNDATQSWDSYTDGWNTFLGNKSPISYRTPVIDLGVDVSFAPLVTVTATGTVTITIRHSTGAQGAPAGAFGPVPNGEILARYVQVQVSVAHPGAPVIEEIETVFDAQGRVDRFQDINTATFTAPYYQRLGAGHFRMATKSQELVAISQGQIVAFQNVGGGGWSSEVVSKTVSVGGQPAAEFKLYNAFGNPADATVDIELRGPKR